MELAPSPPAPWKCNVASTRPPPRAAAGMGRGTRAGFRRRCRRPHEAGHGQGRCPAHCGGKADSPTSSPTVSGACSCWRRPTAWTWKRNSPPQWTGSTRSWRRKRRSAATRRRFETGLARPRSPPPRRIFFVFIRANRAQVAGHDHRRPGLMVADHWKDYQLLDCGMGMKHEQSALHPRAARPADHLAAHRRQRALGKLDACCHRSETGGGKWESASPCPTTRPSATVT